MRETIQTLQQMTADSPYKEICGILSGSDIISISNRSPRPNAFVMDRGEYYTHMNILQQSGRPVTAIYHSHTAGSPAPTVEDLQCQQRLKLDFLIVTSTSYRWIPYAP